MAKRKTYTVEPPTVAEGLIPAIPALLAEFKKKKKPIARCTLDRYRQNGMPIEKGGDRIKLPIVRREDSGFRPMTSKAAIKRFFARVKELRNA